MSIPSKVILISLHFSTVNCVFNIFITLILQVLTFLLDRDSGAIEPVYYDNYHEEGYHINQLLADVEHYEAFAPNLDVDHRFKVDYTKDCAERNLEE